MSVLIKIVSWVLLLFHFGISKKNSEIILPEETSPEYCIIARQMYQQNPEKAWDLHFTRQLDSIKMYYPNEYEELRVNLINNYKTASSFMFGMKEKGAIKITPSMPISAEYCIKESLDKNNLWDLHLVRVLDSIQKIYPYEYEELRECRWQGVNPVFSIRVNPRPLCGSLGSFYSLPVYPSFPAPVTVKEYYFTYKDKFYIHIPYYDFFYDVDFEGYNIVLDSNYHGIMTIEWDISGGCPPDDKLKYYFFGTYDARIIGKCREEDLKNGDVGE